MRYSGFLPALLLTVAAGCAPDSPRPDVVLVVIDTLRADRTSILPGGPDTTPHLADWASNGIVYSQAISPASWTLPSMASMLAGQPVSRNRGASFPDQPLLAEYFAKAGYRTVGIVANPLLTVDNDFTRGFDTYDVAPARSTASLNASPHDLRAWDAQAITSRAIQAIDATPEGTPLFLFLHLMDPHIPYDRVHTKLALPEAGWSQDDGGGLVGWTDALDKSELDLLSGWRRNYDGQILYTDDALGRLFEQIEEIRSRPALIAVTSDHGEGLFTHRRNPDSRGGDGLLAQGYDDHGEQVYEEALRVPLWLVGPGVPAGRVEARPVALYDLAGSLLSLAGVGAAERHLPLEPDDPAPPEIFGCSTRGWFLRGSDFKLVMPSAERADKRGIQPELFRVAAERYLPETEDLSGSEAESMAAFVMRWQDWMTELADQDDGPMDEATLERLQELGYLR